MPSERNCDLDLTEAESVKRRDAQVKQQADAARETKRAAYERHVNQRTYERTMVRNDRAFETPLREAVFTRRMAAWGEPGSVALLTEQFPCSSADVQRRSLLAEADRLELTPLPTPGQWAALLILIEKLRAQAKRVARCKTCYNCRKWEI